MWFRTVKQMNKNMLNLTILFRFRGSFACLFFSDDCSVWHVFVEASFLSLTYLFQITFSLAIFVRLFSGYLWMVRVQFWRDKRTMDTLVSPLTHKYAIVRSQVVLCFYFLVSKSQPKPSWWLNQPLFSTHLKNISQIGNLPQLGVKIKKKYLKPPPTSSKPLFATVTGRKWRHSKPKNNSIQKSTNHPVLGDFWTQTIGAPWTSIGKMQMDVFFNRINITNKSVEFFHIMLKSIKGDSFEERIGHFGDLGVYTVYIYIYIKCTYTYIYIYTIQQSL